MRILVLLFATLFTASAWATDPTPLTVTSAANPNVGITADSLASIFGGSISTVTMSAPAPWPTSLGDVSVVLITDSTNKQTMAGILFVSPAQMNIYIPPSVAPGPATIQFPVTGLPIGVGTAALRSVSVNIQKVAPALFSAEGTGAGVAAATAIRVTIPTQIQSPVPVFTCGPSPACTAIPIDPGVDAPVYISLYGTGIRGASSLANVTVNIGNTTVKALYAGPQPGTAGLDQVNFGLPLALHGAGLVNVTVTVDGVTSNAVQLAIQ